MNNSEKNIINNIMPFEIDTKMWYKNTKKLDETYIEKTINEVIKVSDCMSSTYRKLVMN